MAQGTPAEVAEFEAQLRGAIAYRRKFGREDRWREYIRILGHRFYPNGVDEDSPTINIVGARVRAQAPRLAFGRPAFDVRWTGPPPDANTEAMWAAFLDETWRKEGFDRATKRIALDWPLIGFGVGFVGFEQATDEEIVDPKRRLFGLVSPAITERVRKATKGASDAVSTTEDTVVRVSYKERIFLERVSPLDCVFDPCASAFDDMQFMARRLFLSEQRGKLMFGDACPKADSSANVALYRDIGENEDPGADQENHELSTLLPDEVKRVAVWELWSITRRKTVYLDSKARVIPGQVYDWRSPHPGFPMPAMLWDEIPDCVYPEGLAAALKPGNDELHLLRKRELAEAGKAITKTVVQGGKLNAAQLKALKSKIDGEVVNDVPDDITFNTLQRQPMQADFWTIEDRMKSDLNEVSQTSPYEAAAMPTVRKSATEASFVQGASDAMSSMRQDSVERFAVAVAERVMALAMSTMNDPIPLTILNQDPELVDDETGELIPVGAPTDVQFIPMDHIGTCEVRVTPGSMMASARDVERNQLIAAAQLFANEPWLKKREVALAVFGSIPSVRDATRFIATPAEEAVAATEAAQNGQMPPEGEQPPPVQGVMEGSGNMTADLLAATAGGQAPMTG